MKLPDGWFADDDIEEYRRLVRAMPDGGHLVELGVWLGRSLCSVADILIKKKIRVTAVDTFKGTENEGDAHAIAKSWDIHDMFCQNVREFGLNVRVLKMRTVDASLNVGKADLVFIDADHSREAVAQDIRDWSKKTTVIAGHDYGGSHAGVKEAVDAAYPKARVHGSVWSSKAKGTVLAFVPTKDRYDSLSLTLQGIAMQDVKPDALMIYDDGEHRDLRQVPMYAHILRLLDEKGIGWSVVFGDGRGQHWGHEHANRSGYTYVWRVDDDEVPEPDVLGILLQHMEPTVGAVGGAVVIPGGDIQGGTGMMRDSLHTPNIQWGRGYEIKEVEHLYSSFLYRAGVVSYCLDLSPVAHSEETIFTHELCRAGYRLIVDRSAVTYHYRNPDGGIRSHGDAKFLFEHDDKVRLEKFKQWGYKLVHLDCGLGDHYAFLNALPAVIESCQHVIIGCCYPELFSGMDKVTVVPVSATASCGVWGVYKWMSVHGWTGSLVKAFFVMNGVGDSYDPDVHAVPEIEERAAEREAAAC